MSSITIELAPETERRLRAWAGQSGQSLEAFLQHLADAAAGEAGAVPTFRSRPQISDAEFERNLQALASGDPLPQLPADFSRADIYDDHD